MTTRRKIDYRTLIRHRVNTSRYTNPDILAEEFNRTFIADGSMPVMSARSLTRAILRLKNRFVDK